MLKMFIRAFALLILILLSCSKVDNNPLNSDNRSVIRGTIYCGGVPTNDYMVIARRISGTAVTAKVASIEKIAEVANGQYSIEVEPGDYRLEIFNIKHNYDGTYLVSVNVTVRDDAELQQDIHVDEDLYVPIAKLEVISSGLYIKGRILTSSFAVSRARFFIKKPGEEWKQKNIDPFIWYDTLYN
ncbi:MAG: hypothetical protein JNL74_14440, partial [Fibrobacteres bacterium]|nr:hypothetical protein [Fibrobacterota bacterium]